jgi:predicted enzyme related to lactoylglutathione lyase
MNKMNPVVHFELPAENSKRMAEFYTKTFGWLTHFLGPEMGNYVMVETIDSDENGNPKSKGAINGGFFQKTSAPETQHPSVVIAVDDINESIEKVKDSGGTISGKPTEIPGVGLYVSFIDTEGNRLSLLQPIGIMGSK